MGKRAEKNTFCIRTLHRFFRYCAIGLAIVCQFQIQTADAQNGAPTNHSSVPVSPTGSQKPQPKPKITYPSPRPSGDQGAVQRSDQRSLNRPNEQRDFSIQCGIGMMFKNISKVTNNETSAVSLFGPVMPAIILGLQQYWNEFGFHPQIAFAPLGRTSADRAVKALPLNVILPAVYQLEGIHDLKVGLAWMLEFLSGNGGEVSLNNGASTQTFYRPSNSAVTGILALQLGYGTKIYEELRLDFDLVLSGLLSERRTVHSQLSLSWGFL